MPNSYDQGFSKITQLSTEFDSGKHIDINEDTTRLRFVDTILFECLDWDRFSQVETEEQTEVGIIDYSMNLDVTLLIVEAKRTGISFELPIEQGKAGRTVRTIESLSSLDKKIRDALTQSANYALEKGAPFAAVTNGWQLIAFCTQQAPGISWRKGNALVFDNLAAMVKNFKTLWNNLSVEGIKRFELRRTLTNSLSLTPCPKRSATISNFNRSKNRNSFQADLQILGDLVFGGRIFEDRTLFHEHCYCAGGALPQFSRASRSYLEDRYPDLFSTTAGTPSLQPAQTKKGPAAALTNLTNIRKPILLLGDVGVGKTTFLEHLFLVDWADKKNDLITMRIDLADKPSKPDDLPNLVAKEIEKSLLTYYDIDITENKFLRGVYHSELARFRKSPVGALADHDAAAFAKAEIAHIEKMCAQFDEHLRNIFAHLVKGRRKMIVLIFDNVDQRDAAMQKATFIQAQIAASTWDIFVMVALRPETYVKSKLHGELSGYHPRAFTIAPPRFDQLIEKRVNTAIQILRGDLPFPNIGAGARIQIEGVADYLEVMRYSFAQEPELLSFCEDISGGNMRLALDYIVAFMSCGHVDAQKILTRWEENKSYKIPLHEFTRGVMFADREYYSGNTAAIMNVFDCKTGDARETFGVLTLLSMLAAETSNATTSSKGSGFVSIEDARRRLVSVGYQYEQAVWIFERCMGNRLVETNLKSGDFEEATHVRISPTGSYYYHKLIRSFTYADAVSVDTPICSKSALDRITDVSLLTQRLERTRCFINYLDEIAKSFPSLRAELEWDEISVAVKADVSKAQDSNERAILRANRVTESH
jgi:GTPase SAR1 family protein